MQALIFDKSKKKVTLETVPRPKLVNDDDVIVEVMSSGVCGTDVHIFHGDISNVGDRFIPGHESGGRVVEVGPSVSQVQVGDIVAVDPNRGCHKCNFCKNSQPHFCPVGSFNDAIGIVRSGGFAQFLVAPEEQIYKIPPGLSPEMLCLVEPLSCVLHGWRKLNSVHNLRHHAEILIQGAGVIGVLWATLFHFNGFRKVTVSEPSDVRKNIVRDLDLGYKMVNPSDLQKEEFTVVVDCSGNTRAIQSGIQRVGHGGIFLQFGVAPQGATCEIEPFHIYEREITIQGVMVNPWTFPEALQVVCDMTPRYLTLAKMGIKKFSLKEFETCFEQLGKGQIGKASFVPN